METFMQARNRAFKGIVGRPRTSKFERARRAAKAERLRLEKSEYDMKARDRFSVQHAGDLLHELCDQDKRLARIARRDERKQRRRERR